MLSDEELEKEKQEKEELERRKKEKIQRREKEREERKASAQRKEQERLRKERELEASTESEKEENQRLVVPISEERRGADLVAPEVPNWLAELGKTTQCEGCTLLAQQVADMQKELKALKKKLLKNKVISLH